MTALLAMRGPEFLALFIGTSLAVFFLVRAAIVASEPRSDGMRVRDPYMIAYLRGGLEELIRVVVLSLAIRGLLKISGTGIQTADPTEIRPSRPPHRESDPRGLSPAGHPGHGPSRMVVCGRRVRSLSINS